MSFMKLVATMAVGFAAAKGFDAFNKGGGMAGMQDRMKSAGQPGGMADQLGQMAEKMGIPGGAATMRNMAQQMGQTGAGAAAAGGAGLGNLMGAVAGLAGGATQAMTGMAGALPGTGPALAAGEDTARLMLRAMIMAAKADGTIDGDERARIMAYAGDATPEERAFIEAQMDAPIDVTALAADTSEAMKAQVYAAAVMAIKVDNPAESDFLAALAEALGIAPATRDSVHSAMGGG